MCFPKGIVCCAPNHGSGGVGQLAGCAEMIVVIKKVSRRSVGMAPFSHEEWIGPPGAVWVPAIGFGDGACGIHFSYEAFVGVHETGSCARHLFPEAATEGVIVIACDQGAGAGLFVPYLGETVFGVVNIGGDRIAKGLSGHIAVGVVFV